MRSLIIGLLCTAAAFAADATLDGTKIHYESYGKGKEALVFVHGWTCDLTFWRGQAPLYEKHRSLLIDLPGHGQSGKPETAYTMDLFARSIDAVMRDAGVDRATLIGHSMGVPVIYTFFRLFPAKTTGLVLVDGAIPQSYKDEAARENQRKQMAGFLASFKAPNGDTVRAGMVNTMFSAKTTPAMREEIRSKMLAAPAHVAASAMDGMFGAEGPGAGQTFDLPITAIVVANPARAAWEPRLRSVFPKLYKYDAWEGSGHFLMMESPDRFNAALEEFIGTIKRK